MQDRYYINAYSLAVQRGFCGTIDEWLASLKGERGEPGFGIIIKELYATEEELLGAHASGEPGDYYAVGNESNNVIYFWDEDNQQWQNLGSLKGESILALLMRPKLLSPFLAVMWAPRGRKASRARPALPGKLARHLLPVWLLTAILAGVMIRG